MLFKVKRTADSSSFKKSMSTSAARGVGRVGGMAGSIGWVAELTARLVDCDISCLGMNTNPNVLSVVPSLTTVVNMCKMLPFSS